MDALLLAETLSLLVRESLEAGDLSAAEARLGELRSLSRVVDEGGVPAYCARAEGWAYAHRGDSRQAVAAHAAAVDRWKRLGWQYEWAQSALALAAVHRDLGETSRARELSDQAAERLTRAGARG
jgi:tetratricopeptide (TPR) repeat protein